MRTALLTTFLFFTLWASASANWFNQSEAYLAACQDEAVRRYHKGTSSEDVRRHILSCACSLTVTLFENFCDRRRTGFDADCYRLKYKTEGR